MVSCEHCTRAVIGHFLSIEEIHALIRAGGRPAQRVPADLLVQCAAGHWRSVITHTTLVSNPKDYRAKAAACPHYTPKNTA